MIDLSIIIVTYNSEDTISKCLNSIFKFTKGVQFEIIIVDNNSKDKTLEKIEKFKDQIKLIKNNKNLGFGKACNQGAKESKGEALLFLNPDTEVCNDSISGLFRFMSGDQDAYIVGPMLLNIDGTWQRGHIPLKWYQQIDYFIFKKPFYFVDRIIGAALMIGKKDFHDLDGFDENYFILFEDTDLCLQVKRLGKKIVLNTYTQVKHIRSKSFTDIKQYTKFYKESFKYFLNKNFTGITKIWVWLVGYLRINWIRISKKI